MKIDLEDYIEFLCAIMFTILILFLMVALIFTAVELYRHYSL